MFMRRFEMEEELSNTDLITNSTDEEIFALENFKRRYKALVPPPTKPTVTLMSALGWQFWAIMVQSLAAIVLVGMRTASMFYDVSFMGMQSVLMALIEAGAAVIAVEAGIVIFSSLRAEIQNRKNDASLSGESAHIEVKASMSRLLVGEVACILLSLVAGFGVSAKGLGMTIIWLPWLMLFGLAGGATIIVAVSGDIIGVTLARLANLQTVIADKFEVTKQKYDEGMFRAWNASDERKIARHEIREAVQPVHVRRSTNTPRTSSERTPIVSDVANIISEYLMTHSTNEYVPGPSEISRVLDVSKGYAHRIRNEWIAANAPAFVDQSPPEVPIAT
jgi:hypothetical protein